MTLPTATEFKARHIRFDAVADATVSAYLAEAGRSVDVDVWVENDYADGVMYLAAHLLEIEGAVAPTGKTLGTAGAVVKQKAGSVEITREAVKTTGASRYDDLYGSTSYGKRYLELAGRNTLIDFPAILVV